MRRTTVNWVLMLLRDFIFHICRPLPITKLTVVSAYGRCLIYLPHRPSTSFGVLPTQQAYPGFLVTPEATPCGVGGSALPAVMGSALGHEANRGCRGIPESCDADGRTERVPLPLSFKCEAGHLGTGRASLWGRPGWELESKRQNLDLSCG